MKTNQRCHQEAPMEPDTFHMHGYKQYAPPEHEEFDYVITNRAPWHSDFFDEKLPDWVAPAEHPV